MMRQASGGMASRQNNGMPEADEENPWHVVQTERILSVRSGRRSVYFLYAGRNREGDYELMTLAQ
jgi:hypothetical protein